MSMYKACKNCLVHIIILVIKLNCKLDGLNLVHSNLNTYSVFLDSALVRYAKDVKCFGIVCNIVF